MPGLCGKSGGRDTGATVRMNACFSLPWLARACYLWSMKTTAILVVALLSLSFHAFAEQANQPFRVWTQLGSGKTIEAQLIEKDGERVKVVLRNGKAHWLALRDVMDADREYVETWGAESKEPDPVTVTNSIKINDYTRAITVTVVERDEPCVLKIYRVEKAPLLSETVRIKAGEVKEWSGPVSLKYKLVLEENDGTEIFKVEK